MAVLDLVTQHGKRMPGAILEVVPHELNFSWELLSEKLLKASGLLLEGKVPMVDQLLCVLDALVVHSGVETR